MFESFTAAAIQVVTRAQDAARQLGHYVVDTEHLLLGVAEVDDPIAAPVLHNLGVTPDLIRERLVVLDRRGGFAAETLAFSPTAKAVLAAAFTEARTFGASSIDVADILWACVQYPDCTAAAILASRTGDLMDVRDAINTATAHLRPVELAGFDAAAHATVVCASLRAAQLGKDTIDVSDIVYGLAGHSDTTVSSLLAAISMPADPRCEGTCTAPSGIGSESASCNCDLSARRVLRGGRRHAAALGHPEVTPVHLLLALTDPGNERLLAEAGMHVPSAALDEIRRQVREVGDGDPAPRVRQSRSDGGGGVADATAHTGLFGAHDWEGDDDDTPGTVSVSTIMASLGAIARQAVEHALAAAERDGLALITAEQLLVSIATVTPDDYITRYLDNAGITPADLNRCLHLAIDALPRRRGQIPTSGTKARQVLDVAYREMQGNSDPVVSVVHMMVGIAALRATPAADVLHDAGLTSGRVRAEIVTPEEPLAKLYRPTLHRPSST